MLFIPAPENEKQEKLWAQGQPGLHRGTLSQNNKSKTAITHKNIGTGKHSKAVDSSVWKSFGVFTKQPLLASALHQPHSWHYAVFTDPHPQGDCLPTPLQSPLHQKSRDQQNCLPHPEGESLPLSVLHLSSQDSQSDIWNWSFHSQQHTYRLVTCLRYIHWPSIVGNKNMFANTEGWRETWSQLLCQDRFHLWFSSPASSWKVRCVFPTPGISHLLLLLGAHCRLLHASF